MTTAERDGNMTEADMRAFGASDGACYLWPDDTDEHKALRAAYIRGAADGAPTMVAPILETIATYMGGLCAAAKSDVAAANPADVGLNGVPIVGWRKAYLEGCKDMANGVFTCVPENLRAAFLKAARAAFGGLAPEPGSGPSPLGAACESQPEPTNPVSIASTNSEGNQ